MPTSKKPRPRAFVTFDELTYDLLQQADALTNLGVSHIVNQLMRAHVQELAEYVDWLKRQEGETHGTGKRALGIHALEAYGPNDLITEMRSIDPTYQPPQARVMAAGKNVIDDLMLNDLRAVVADWKAKQAAKGTGQ